MEKTKILLNNALLELLEENTFDNIKVIEICDKAMVHKTTFYNHFEDKYELLNYSLLKIHKDIKERAVKDKGIIEYYLSIAKCYIKYIKDNPKLFKSIISDGDNNIGLRLFHKLYVEDIELKINKTKAYNIPSNYVANFYVDGVFSLISEWFVTGMKEDESTILFYIEKLIKGEIPFYKK